LGYYKTSSSKYGSAYISTSTGVFEPTLTKGNLTATSPIALDNTRQVIGGAAVISISDYISATDVSSNFFPSSLGKSLYDWSSNALTLYGASSHNHDGMASTWTWSTPIGTSGASISGTGMVSGNLGIYLANIPQTAVKSGANWQQAYVSTSTGVFEPSLSKSNLTATSPVSISNSPQIIGASAADITISNYIGSTQAIDRFADSSNINSRFVASGVILNAISSTSISGGAIYGKYYKSTNSAYLYFGGDDAYPGAPNLVVLKPSINNKISLGDITNRFKNGYFSGSFVAKNFRGMGGFIDNQIQHTYDNDTQIIFNTNNLQFEAGGNIALSIASGGTNNIWFSSNAISSAALRIGPDTVITRYRY